ncbi:MAG: DNA phosphorothioation-associated putative methyltransferase [Gammaproteobacteria bacterium]|nr:DNA phosphorothioation-associated putative methyltransferase [Gammaproteobacteria bacterium]
MTSTIERRRTALRRSALSSPMQHLLRFGFLDGTRTLFDYGCGRGDDLRLLAQMKVPAAGWDPVFRPDVDRQPADIVNLGFVLNVIEDARERRETLQAAFKLARKVLIVSVMLGYQSKREQFAAFEDGVRTQRNTFQKYYAQDEFRSYVEKTLEANAIPLAAGICIVFKDAVEEQLFLLARQQVRREWRLLRREPDGAAVASMIEDHKEQIDAYWLRALELGRPAAPEECPEAQSLIRLVGSWRRVHEWVGRFFNPAEFEAAAIGRQEDLLVYFALGHFGRRRPVSELPDRLQRDVQFFFGSITKARNAGKRALFATGDSGRLEEAAAFCHDELGIGVLNDDHDLTFHQSVLGECLPLIRIYVGCALQLFGDAGSVDLIKVHLQSGKVTFLVYDDFEGAATPRLIERIKVDLPRLRVDFFDYVGEYEPQPLSEDREGFYQR